LGGIWTLVLGALPLAGVALRSIRRAALSGSEP
jgi:hypothetical protein